MLVPETEEGIPVARRPQRRFEIGFSAEMLVLIVMLPLPRSLCVSMIFSENRFPLFRIML